MKVTSLPAADWFLQHSSCLLSFSLQLFFVWLLKWNFNIKKQFFSSCSPNGYGCNRSRRVMCKKRTQQSTWRSQYNIKRRLQRTTMEQVHNVHFEHVSNSFHNNVLIFLTKETILSCWCLIASHNHINTPMEVLSSEVKRSSTWNINGDKLKMLVSSPTNNSFTKFHIPCNLIKYLPSSKRCFPLLFVRAVVLMSHFAMKFEQHET